MGRLAHLDTFYALLEEAKKKYSPRLLKDLARTDIPVNAVYFFFDPTQKRDDNTTNKVIRVGTHAARKNSKATVYKRLYQHKGTLKGYGNHRSSVFRELVGEGVVNKHNIKVSSWGQGKQKTANEAAIENMVSTYLSQLEFMLIEVPGEAHKDNDRAKIEKYSIALLSNYNGIIIDQPNNKWLGYNTQRKKICKSGLWNSDYVDYALPDYRELFFLMENHISKMKRYH